MKILFQIAKNEWRYLFYSPIAWFVLLVFMVQCAFLYTDPMYYYANWQDILQKNSPSWKGFDVSLTDSLFIGSNVLGNVLHNLYFFVPVLTMGLISRDVNSGAFKLLYSAPISIRQLVIGKYIGIVFYNLLLVGILLLFMITAFFNIKEVDYGLLLSAALGFYLLVCTYSAIGLFMSALTNYQVVAALSTFTLLFVLNLIGGLWQRYDLVRDLTYFLSLQDRTLKMLKGLIVTRDVIYFIVVAFMFVGFTIIKLNAGRQANPWYIKAGRYLSVLAVTLLIGYFSSRPVLTGYLDATATKKNTVPIEMQRLIKAMGDSTLEVTLYTNLLGDNLQFGLPEARNASYMAKMWEPYLRFKPGIQFKYVYYYDTQDSALLNSRSRQTLRQRAEDRARVLNFDISRFRTPEEMHAVVNLQPEDYRLIMQLKYRGRTEYLRTYSDPGNPWPNVTNVAAAFKRLLEPEKIPHVYFVTGELERSLIKTGEREYSAYTAARLNRSALINIGFDVDTINLTTQEIPKHCTALILADPKMDLSPVVFNKLTSYGGNMLIKGEPGKQYVLNPLLQQMGVQLMNGQLVQPGYHETPDKVTPYLTSASKALLGIQTAGGDENTSARMMMPGVTGISYLSKSIKPLLMTVPHKTWLKAGKLVVDSTLPPLNPAEGDFKETKFTTGLQLTNKEQRVIVLGDADFAGNMRFRNNYAYLVALYGWLTYNEFPVQMSARLPKDVMLNISERSARLQKIVYLWVAPGILLLAAIILLVRRKRQ